LVQGWLLVLDHNPTICNWASEDAIKNHDLKTFEQYADVDAISSIWSMPFSLNQCNAHWGKAHWRVHYHRTSHGFEPQMTASMKQQLLDYVKEEILRGVAEGDESGRRLNL